MRKFGVILKVQGHTEHPSTTQVVIIATSLRGDNTGNGNIQPPNVQTTALPTSYVQGTCENEII